MTSTQLQTDSSPVFALARWLDDTRQHIDPDSLPLPHTLTHPGDEFPLRTLPSLPSDSSLSDGEDDIYPVSRPATASLARLHPPTPTMESAAATNARRRSSSLLGPGPSKKDPRRSRRRSDHIAEEGEDKPSSDDATHSDSDSPSDSTDFELGDMSGDGLEDDEETGLTQRDRRRRRRRKRRNTLLDQRIVPEVTYTKEEKKLADLSLMRSMMVNGALICLWYANVDPGAVLARGMTTDSLTHTHQVPLFNIHIRVQQVDVQGRKRRWRNQKHFPLSTIHNVSSHDCPILARISGAVPGTLLSTAARLAQSSRPRHARGARRPQEAAHDQVVLFFQTRPVWCCDRHGHWVGQYEFEVHLVDVFQ